MYFYAGYGFDSSKISNETLLEMLKTHDEDEYKQFVEDCMENYGIATEEMLLKEVRGRINDTMFPGGLPNWIAAIVNEGEAENLRKGEDFVEGLDKYVIFPPLTFSEDGKRALIAKNAGEFSEIIGKYLKLEELTFGPVYAGDDWDDMNYFME